MKEVYSTTNLGDAEMVRILLRNFGIETLLQGVDPGLSGPATPITLSVSDAAAPDALAILEREGKLKPEAPPPPPPAPEPAAPAGPAPAEEAPAARKKPRSESKPKKKTKEKKPKKKGRR